MYLVSIYFEYQCIRKKWCTIIGCFHWNKALKLCVWWTHIGWGFKAKWAWKKKHPGLGVLISAVFFVTRISVGTWPVPLMMHLLPWLHSCRGLNFVAYHFCGVIISYLLALESGAKWWPHDDLQRYDVLRASRPQLAKQTSHLVTSRIHIQPFAGLGLAPGVEGCVSTLCLQ
jgi:hypothetical protein